MVTLTSHWPFLQIKRISWTDRAIGWTSLFVCILCGSTFLVFGKFISVSLSPLTLLFLSESLTLLFALCSFGLLPIVKHLLSYNRQSLYALCCVGILNGVVGPLLLFVALKGTTAINANFFSRIELVFLLIIASTFLKEKITRMHIISSVIILGGVLLIASGGFNASMTLTWSDGLVMLSMLIYAIGNSIFRKYLSHSDPEVTVFARSFFAVSTFFIAAPFLEQSLLSELTQFPTDLIPILFGFAFISRFLSTFSFYESAEKLPLSTIYPFLMLQVVGAAFFSYLLLNEHLYWYHFVGGALILGGNFLLQHKTELHKNEQHLKHHVVERAVQRVTR